jgi:hypothetical protein
MLDLNERLHARYEKYVRAAARLEKRMKFAATYHGTPVKGFPLIYAGDMLSDERRRWLNY